MKKDEIIKEKTKLKDTDIWLSDDLTKRRSELAYAARQAVKNGKINMTWVHDSKIFTKKKANDKPSILYDIEDLPNWLSHKVKDVSWKGNLFYDVLFLNANSKQRMMILHYLYLFQVIYSTAWYDLW